MMKRQESSDDYKSIPSPQSTQLSEQQSRLSFLSQKQLLQIYTENNKRKRQLQALIDKLEPKILEKKLAAELEHNSRVTAIQIIVDSDENDEFADVQFDIKAIKDDFTTKKNNLDDIKKNKYAPLQVASLRKIWEKQMCNNEHIIQLISSKYKVRAYFPFTSMNKFGVLVFNEEDKNYIIKFVSVGIPEGLFESVLIDFEVFGVYSKNLRLIIVGENEASLYDIEAKDYILKTHRHESKIVYAGFPNLQVDTILTVTQSGIVRLFDVSAKAFYWMCMTDAQAANFFVREDKLYYSVGCQLFTVNLKTKQMASVHKFSQRIEQIRQRHLKSGKFYFSTSKTGFQTKNESDYIKLTDNSKYYKSGQNSHLTIKDNRVQLKSKDSQLIGVFTIKSSEMGQEVTEKKVAIFGGKNGQTQQIKLENCA